MKTIFFTICIAIVFVGSGVFLYESNKEKKPEMPLYAMQNEDTVIEGWPEGVPLSTVLSDDPKEVKPKVDISEWDEYIHTKHGYRLEHPKAAEEFFLKEHIMEENTLGPWYGMDNTLWSIVARIPEPIRDDAEGLFAISVFIKEGEFEEIVQKVRETIVSGKTFLSERMVSVGELEGIRVSVVNKEETSYVVAYILRKPSEEKTFIIDVVINQILEEPSETEEEYTDRVIREGNIFDAVVSTFEIL